MNKKHILLLVGLLFFFTSSLLSQISEQSKSMSQGLNNALVLEIPDSDEKFVEKVWKKFAREFKGKTKELDRKRNEWFSDNAKVPALSSNTANIYTQIEQSGEDVDVSMWIDIGGSYLNSGDHYNDYTEAEKLLLRFGLEVAQETVRLEIVQEKKELKKLESTLERLKRSNEGYHREIETAKERISKAEENIVTNEQEQENALNMIEEQKQLLEEVRRKLEELDL
ncbi:MAG: hypothetical protein GY705_15055 [Bacteroidetes bacterium]|nr:hypothetical protein [Bacteroidota bacterium]